MSPRDIYIWHKASSPPPPPPRDPWAGVGWGPRTPPPYFWVEKLKKRGISLIRNSGRAQFQDLGPDLGLVLGLVSACFCVLQLMPCGAEYPCRCHLCVSDYFCGQHCHTSWPQHRTPKWPPKGHFQQPQHPRQSAAYDCQVGPQIWT